MADEMVTPYCGGCGHLYFNEPKLTLEEAQRQAKTRRCSYCHEEQVEAEEKELRKKSSPEVYWFDPEW